MLILINQTSLSKTFSKQKKDFNYRIKSAIVKSDIRHQSFISQDNLYKTGLPVRVLVVPMGG